jgi:hypothetical protein
VEPAGGETGVPRCLAEVYKLLRSFISSVQQAKKLTLINEKSLPQKLGKTVFWETNHPYQTSVYKF